MKHLKEMKEAFLDKNDKLAERLKNLEEEIKREEMNNKNKRHKIDILKREYEEINERFQLYKEQTTKQVKE